MIPLVAKTAHGDTGEPRCSRHSESPRRSSPLSLSAGPRGPCIEAGTLGGLREPFTGKKPGSHRARIRRVAAGGVGVVVESGNSQEIPFPWGPAPTPFLGCRLVQTQVP